MAGWFAVKRGITEHPLFLGRPDRLAVWIWLLDNAAWKETTQDVNGHTIIIPRGSVSATERRISERTGVGRQVIRTFLARLEADTMITRTLTHGRHLIYLTKWDTYQMVGSATNPDKNPGLTQDQPIKGTREQDSTLEANASNGADAPLTIEVSVLSKAVWDAGKAYLSSHGVANPGAVIGRWLKTYPPIDVLAAVGASQKSGTKDPVPYITEALKGKPNGKSGKAQDRLNAFIAGARGTP